MSIFKLSIVQIFNELISTLSNMHYTFTLKYVLNKLLSVHIVLLPQHGETLEVTQ